MDTDRLQRAWSRTLGPGADWETLSAAASYRPPGASAAAASDDDDEQTAPTLDDAAAGSALLQAEEIAGYRAVSELGRGGMGVVWRARQSSLQREVAVKSLLPNADTEARQRFLSEARLTSWLEHPNIVPVHDLLNHDGPRPCLAMKLVDGQPWSSQLRNGPAEDLEPQLEILIQVCHAVAFAHSRGVVHLDLKPDNVMLGAFGEVQLMDWGLAVRLEAQPGGERLGTQITRPCGTPAYMAPELANGDGEHIGLHTDVYQLGGILCRLLSGRSPHGGRRFIEAITRAATGAPPELPAEAPEELARLCRHALAADPQERPARVEDFQSGLRTYLRHSQSLAIAARATVTLARCQTRAQAPGTVPHELYSSFAEAVAGFREARRLWEANEPAHAGEQRARQAWARAALAHDDLGLAAAQLDELEEHAEPELRARLLARRRYLEKRERTRRLLKLGLLISCLLLVASLLLTIDRNLKIDSQNQALRQANEQELAQRNKAQDREEIARGLLLSMLGEVHAKLVAAGDSHTHAAAAELLVAASQGLERLAASNPGSNNYLWDLARAHFYMGDAQRSVFGDPEAARRELTAVVAMLSGADRSELDPEARLGLIDQTCWQLAQLALQADSLTVVEQWHQLALDNAAQLLARDASNHVAKVAQINHLAGRAEVRRLQGRPQASAQLYTQAWESYQAVCARAPAPLELGIQSAVFRGAVALAEQGELEAARAFAEQGLERARQRLALTPNNAHRQLDLSLALHIRILVSELAREIGSWTELSSEMTALLRPLQQRDPGNKAAAVNLASALHHQARCLLAQGRGDDALEPLSEATRSGRELCARYPQDLDLLRDLSFRLAAMAEIFWNHGQLAEARPLLEECLRLRRQLGQDSSELRLQRELCLALRDLGRLLVDLGEEDSAFPLFQESIERMRRLLAAFPDHPQVRFDFSQDHESLASAHHKASRLEEAALEYARCRIIRQELWQQTGLPIYRAALSETLAHEGLTWASLGEMGRAEELLQRARELAEQRVADDEGDLDARRMLGTALCSLAWLAEERGELLTGLANIERSQQLLEPLIERDAQARNVWQAGRHLLRSLLHQLMAADLLEPRTAEEHMLHGHVLLERAAFEEAVEAFAAAEAEGAAALDSWLSPMLAAGQAHGRAAPDKAAQYAERGLRWLALYLESQALLRAAGDSQALAQWQNLRDVAVELQSLRALPEFGRLFAE